MGETWQAKADGRERDPRGRRAVERRRVPNWAVVGCTCERCARSVSELNAALY